MSITEAIEFLCDYVCTLELEIECMGGGRNWDDHDKGKQAQAILKAYVAEKEGQGGLFS